MFLVRYSVKYAPVSIIGKMAMLLTNEDSASENSEPDLVHYLANTGVRNVFFLQANGPEIDVSFPGAEFMLELLDEQSLLQ